MTNARGQALIETTAFFVALAVLLSGFVAFTQWFGVRQKLLLAAKQGALLYSSGRWTRSEVEQRMRQFLVQTPPALDPAGVFVRVGPKGGASAWIGELDESVAEYRPLEMSERFVVKHAPHYWAPVQPLGGPAIPYGS